VTGDDSREIDCREILAEVYLYLDLECDESRRSLIQAHLDECHPCLREFGIEREVKALVARCCGRDSAPAKLRDRLRQRIEDIAADPSFEKQLRQRG
jgi:mycothiol system anti-sigma-R factor